MATMVVTGLVGSGKSAWMMSQIIDWIYKDGRTVATNLQVRRDAMEHFFGPFPAGARLLRFVNPCRPSSGYDKPDVEVDKEAELCMEPPAGEDSKLFDAVIVVDEAGYWFRDGKTADTVKRMLERQRHYSWDVWLICPSVEGLSAAVRRAAIYHYHCAQMMNQPKFMGFIPMPPVRRIYQHLGVHGPMVKSQRWAIKDKVLASYDSTGGTYGMEPPQSTMRERHETKRAELKAWYGFAAGTFVLAFGMFLVCARIFILPDLPVVASAAKPELPPAFAEKYQGISLQAAGSMSRATLNVVGEDEKGRRIFGGGRDFWVECGGMNSGLVEPFNYLELFGS